MKRVVEEAAGRGLCVGGSGAGVEGVAGWKGCEGEECGAQS